MTIKKLPSGFWHVRFGPNRFVQWPEGATPCLDDTFGFYDADKEYAAQRAARAVDAKVRCDLDLLQRTKRETQ